MTTRPRIVPAVRSEEGSLFCPECGGEFRAGVSRCADCDLDLVAEPPAAGPLDPLTLAAVFATGDRALLAEAKSRLDGAGIAYLARGEAGHDLLAEGSLPPGLRAAPIELLVRAGDWEAASALLLKAGLAQRRPGGRRERSPPDLVPPLPGAAGRRSRRAPPSSSPPATTRASAASRR